MDNIDNIKSAWQILNKANEQKKYSKAELQNIVKQKSNNEVLKIKRKMIIELYVSIGLFALLFIAILINKSHDIVFVATFLVALIIISFIPYFILRKINVKIDTNIKEYLNNFMFSFKRLYINTYSILIPFAILGSLTIGFNINLTQLITNITIREILLILGIIIISYLLGLITLQLYFKWLYGKHLQRIKDCITELQSEE